MNKYISLKHTHIYVGINRVNGLWANFWWSLRACHNEVFSKKIMIKKCIKQFFIINNIMYSKLWFIKTLRSSQDKKLVKYIEIKLQAYSKIDIYIY